MNGVGGVGVDQNGFPVIDEKNSFLPLTFLSMFH